MKTLRNLFENLNLLNLRYFNVLKEFTNPCHGDAIMLEQLHKQFTLVQHFNLLYSLSLLNRQTVVDLTHVPASRSMPAALNKSKK